MKRFSIFFPSVLAISAALACNAPSRSAPTATQNATEIPSAVPTSEIAVTPTGIQLPDIAGTVNARGTNTPDPNKQGIITGAIRYPSEGHPAINVYAIRTDQQKYQYVAVNANAGQYTMQVPAGDYYILADVPDVGMKAFEGWYSALGKCLIEHNQDTGQCAGQPQSPQSVTVQGGQTVQGIDLTDWFPEGVTLPAVPGQ
jgi:hypothetical protein